jgi:hypothetical protein
MLVAPVVVQLSVVLEPELMLVGLAVKEPIVGLETCPPPLPEPPPFPDPPPLEEPEEPSEDDAPLQFSIPRQAMATRVSAQRRRRARGSFSARETE